MNANLMGVKVELNDERGALKPCLYCGSVLATLTGPSKHGIHAAGVRCDGCGKHIGWLSKAQFAKFTGGADGRAS